MALATLCHQTVETSSDDMITKRRCMYKIHEVMLSDIDGNSLLNESCMTQDCAIRRQTL